ncbi:MAG: polysaccharide biosynthesis tyrosine autokinase, partial [Flavobacteriaceae bacterium]|nr:polysaccharide biosynthesis tyrosine autokinase [Flavobacteriaceae bacterium]
MKENNKFDIELQTFDIKEYFFKIIGYWKLFLVVIVLALIIAKIVNTTSKRIYNLKSIITVSDEQNPLFSSSTNIAFNWGGPSDKVETIITILKSRSHNEKVVKKLNYNIDYLSEGRFRKENVYGRTPFKIELDSLKYQLQGNDIKLDFLSNDEVKISVEFDDEDNKLINYNSNRTKSFMPENLMYEEVFSLGSIIETPFFAFEIVNENALSDLTDKTYFVRFNNFNSTVKKYQKIDISTMKKGTSIIELSLEGTNKKRIEDYINTTVEVLDTDQRIQKIKYAIKTQNYIDTLFKVEANSLKNIESDLGDFKQKNKIYDLSAEGTKILNEVTLLDNESQNIQNKIDYLVSLERYLINNSTLSSDNIPAPAIVNIEDPNIVSSVNNLIVLSKTREGLEKKVNPSYPPLIRVNDQIKLERQILLEHIGSLKNISKNNLNSLQKRLAKNNSKLSSLSPKEQKLLNFQRQYNITETNYNYLKQKSYEAGTAIAANVSDIKVLDKAKDVGQMPIKPKGSFNYLIALMLGTIMPMLYVLTRETLNNKIQTVEEIEKSYKIPVLGVIGKNKYDKNRLVVKRKPNSTIAESFRALRSNIQFLFTKKSLSKTIVVTSSVSGEGKTLCAENMATVFAMSGKKTVLVGLDLRKPKMHTDFESNNDIGVVNYLIGEKTLEEVTSYSGIENLDIITSGPIPPNPSELLINDYTEELFKKLQEKYEYVVIDTPPVGLVADALELFKYSDAIMYMIRQNYTQRGMPKMIDGKYEHGEVKNISYVLNDFEVQNKYGGS